MLLLAIESDRHLSKSRNQVARQLYKVGPGVGDGVGIRVVGGEVVGDGVWGGVGGGLVGLGVWGGVGGGLVGLGVWGGGLIGLGVGLVILPDLPAIFILPPILPPIFFNSRLENWRFLELNTPRRLLSAAAPWIKISKAVIFILEFCDRFYVTPFFSCLDAGSRLERHDACFS